MTPTVPYFSQWESAELVPEFISGQRHAADDPLWAHSGATSAEEYAFWAPRICGVACLRMTLGHLGLDVLPSIPLVNELQSAGAYVRDGNSVNGLIYRPFAEHVQRRWGIPTRVITDLTLEQIRDAAHSGSLVMVSVNKNIRTPQVEAPSKGGHLVLVVAADDDCVELNNPSGLPNQSQVHARVGWADFERFFAGRGVVLGGGDGQTDCPRLPLPFLLMWLEVLQSHHTTPPTLRLVTPPARFDRLVPSATWNPRHTCDCLQPESHSPESSYCPGPALHASD